MTLARPLSHTVGDDILGQATGAGASWYLYDGHGSTRALADSAGAVTSTFSYDAYGVQLGDSPSSLDPGPSSLLFCGEQFDAALQMLYLRARGYDQATGTFASPDPFAGHHSDPQSLHKYAYCHGDPVGGLDPSGWFTLGEVLSAVAQRITWETLTVGAASGAASNVALSLIGMMIKGENPFTVDNGLGLLEDAVLGAVAGAFGAGVSRAADVLKFLRFLYGGSAFAKLQRFLGFVLVPGIVKGTFGTALAFWKDYVHGDVSRWDFETTWKTMFFAVSFASLFEGVSYHVRSGDAGRDEALRQLREEWRRLFNTWHGGRDRQAFLERMYEKAA